LCPEAPSARAPGTRTPGGSDNCVHTLCVVGSRWSRRADRGENAYTFVQKIRRSVRRRAGESLSTDIKTAIPRMASWPGSQASPAHSEASALESSFAFLRLRTSFKLSPPSSTWFPHHSALWNAKCTDKTKATVTLPAQHRPNFNAWRDVGRRRNSLCKKVGGADR
jgi:hypothetical protein